MGAGKRNCAQLSYQFCPTCKAHQKSIHAFSSFDKNKPVSISSTMLDALNFGYLQPPKEFFCDFIYLYPTLIFTYFAFPSQL